MLELLGFESELARDGNEAIELYKRAMASGDVYDVVILDLTVDVGIGGEETIKKLLQIDPDVKAIISSGNLYDAVMTDYKKYGFAAALAKPITKKALRDVLYWIEEGEKDVKFNISDQVLQETTRCPNNFSCLFSGQCGDPDECKVQMANGKNVLFLKSKKALACPYRLPFGKAQICTCPTHFAIYKKYEV